MAKGIDDQRTEAGRREAAGSAARLDTTRADGDRGYGARDGQRESGCDPDRGRGERGGEHGGGEHGGGLSDGAQDRDRADAFGVRAGQRHDDKAGWRSVGGANPNGRLGGEDEKPGDGDPLGDGVR